MGIEDQLREAADEHVASKKKVEEQLLQAAQEEKEGRLRQVRSDIDNVSRKLQSLKELRVFLSEAYEAASDSLQGYGDKRKDRLRSQKSLEEYSQAKAEELVGKYPETVLQRFFGSEDIEEIKSSEKFKQLISEDMEAPQVAEERGQILDTEVGGNISRTRELRDKITDLLPDENLSFRSSDRQASMDRLDEIITSLERSIVELKLQTPEGKAELFEERYAILDEKVARIVARTSDKDSALTNALTIVNATDDAVDQQVVTTSIDRDAEAAYLSNKILEEVVYAKRPELKTYAEGVELLRDYSEGYQEQMQLAADSINTFNEKWQAFTDAHPDIAEYIKNNQGYNNENFSLAGLKPYVDSILQRAKKELGVNQFGTGPFTVSPVEIYVKTNSLPSLKVLTAVVQVINDLVETLTNATKEQLGDYGYCSELFGKYRGQVIDLTAVNGRRYRAEEPDEVIAAAKKPMPAEITALFEAQANSRYYKRDKLELTPARVSSFINEVEDYTAKQAEEVASEYGEKISQKIKLSWLTAEHSNDIDGREAAFGLEEHDKKQQKAVDDLEQLASLSLENVPDQYQTTKIIVDRYDEFTIARDTDLYQAFQRAQEKYFQNLDELEYSSLRDDMRVQYDEPTVARIDELITQKRRELDNEYSDDKKPKAGLFASKQQKRLKERFEAQKSRLKSELDSLSRLRESAQAYDDINLPYQQISKILYALTEANRIGRKHSGYTYNDEHRVGIDQEYELKDLYERVLEAVSKVAGSEFDPQSKQLAKNYQDRAGDIDKLKKQIRGY